MKSKTIEFVTRITYETEDDSPICEESAKENLFEAIENQRENGELTPSGISALNVCVDIQSVEED